MSGNLVPAASYAEPMLLDGQLPVTEPASGWP